MKFDLETEEALLKQKTISVPEAGWIYYRSGTRASYEAALRGDIPVIQVGRKKRVSVELMEKKVRQSNLPPVGAAGIRIQCRCSWGSLVPIPERCRWRLPFH